MKSVWKSYMETYYLVAKSKNVLITRESLKGDFLYDWKKLFPEAKSY